MTNPKIPEPLPSELPAGTRWRGNIGTADEHEWELLKYYATDFGRTRSFVKPDPKREVYTSSYHVFFRADEVVWDTYRAGAGSSSAVKDAILSEAIFPQREVFGTQPSNDELPLVLPLGALTENGCDYSGMLLITEDDDPPVGLSAGHHSLRLKGGGGVYYCTSAVRWGFAREVVWANLTKPLKYATTRTVRQAAKIEQVGEPVRVPERTHKRDPYAIYNYNYPDNLMFQRMVREGKTIVPPAATRHPSTWPEDSGDELYCS